VIRRGVMAGVNPRDTAREVRDTLGLTQRQELAVMNYRRQLEQDPGGSLRRALRDKRSDRLIMRLAREGTGLDKAQIDKLVQRYRERYVKHRSEVIARTESIRALNLSEYALWDEQVRQGLVDAGDLKRFWVYTRDERTREAHREIPSMNREGVGLTERFKTPLGPLRYPGDPAGVAANVVQCRCTVITRIIPVFED